MVDAGPQILEPRDAGPVITTGNIPWTWDMANQVISREPRVGEVQVRWLPVSPNAPARAWAGGVLLRDGRVVGIPFSAQTVLVIDPVSNTSEQWPITGGGVEEGWFGGVLLPDGSVIAIPRQADQFLRIDPVTRTAKRIGEALPPPAGDAVLGRFRGGVLAHSGFVYAAPSGANFIARLDPATETVKRIPLPPQRAFGHTHGAVLFPTGDIAMFSMGDFPGLLIIPSRTGGDEEVWFLPRPSAPGAPAFTGGGMLTGPSAAIAPPQQNAYPVLYRDGLLSWGNAVTGLEVGSANSYFYGAWSTDGHFYVPYFGTASVLRMDASGRSEAINAGMPSFRAVFGAVGLPDGRIIGIPHDRSSWLELKPERAVTVPIESMTSPFLNKL
jgi:hypothetical protein